jgi:hypothetical protein
MSDTARLCELLQAQAQLLRIRIAAAEGTKEYKADWLKNTDTVVRDGSGKFAKKGTSSATPETPTPGQPPTVQEKVGQAVSDTKKVTSLLLEGGEVSVEMLKKLLTDKDFRRRAGLEVGQTGAQAIKRLAEAAKVNPEFTKKLDSYINKFNQDLIKEYGDDGGAMAQAIRKHGNLPPGDNLQQRLELQVAKYKAYEDALGSPEVYEKEEPASVESLAQKVIAASVPIAIGLGITIIPEAIFAGAAFSLTESLIAFAAGEAGVFAADKAMDKLEVDNPVARLGIGLAVGALTGGTAVMGFKTVRAKKAKDLAYISTKETKDAFLEFVDPAYVKKQEQLNEALIPSLAMAGIIDTNKISLLYHKINTSFTNLNGHGIDLTKDQLLLVIKGLERNPATKSSPTIDKINLVIKKLESKQNHLESLMSGDDFKKLKKAADDIDKSLQRESIQRESVQRLEKLKSKKKGLSYLRDLEKKELAKMIDERDKVFDEVSQSLSDFYGKGWGEIFDGIEESYLEAAMLMNRYHLDIDSKTIKYVDKVTPDYIQKSRIRKKEFEIQEKKERKEALAALEKRAKQMEKEQKESLAAWEKLRK